MAEERPLLVCFHAYGQSHADIVYNTNYFREARTRGWFAIAPVQYGGPGGLWDKSFGSVASQHHVEAVLRFVLNTYPVDRDRIYGVGFSMGGGNAMSYAARHRNRQKGAFAAVLNHTGSVALTDVYQESTQQVRTNMETLFFGSPMQTPFEWTRSSSIVLDSSGHLVPGADHMAVNLSGTSIRSVYGAADPTYLVNQTDRLDQLYTALLGSSSMHELVVLPPVSCGAHCWETLDEAEACDWLGMHTLDDNPAEGIVLVDRRSRWGRFGVVPNTTGEFAGFEFQIEALSNQLNLTEIHNVRDITLGLGELGLDPLLPVTLGLGTTDPNGSSVVIHSVANRPILVLRGSTWLSENCSGTGAPTWCYSAADQELHINEPGGSGTQSWLVTF
ncbi:MAG: pimeloyl-ACP methyl ester carboxylesterase [Planctomycetota bacterium]|jgi:pimeloyl-ACP methyl ester carboxylesterase